MPGDAPTTEAALKRFLAQPDSPEGSQLRTLLQDDDFPRGLSLVVRWIVRDYSAGGFARQSPEEWELTYGFAGFFASYGLVSNATLLDAKYAKKVLAVLDACEQHGVDQRAAMQRVVKIVEPGLLESAGYN